MTRRLLERLTFVRRPNEIFFGGRLGREPVPIIRLHRSGPSGSQYDFNQYRGPVFLTRLIVRTKPTR